MRLKEVIKLIESGQVAKRKDWRDRYIWLKERFVITPDKCFDPILKRLAEVKGQLYGEPWFQECDEGCVSPYNQTYEDTMANDWSIIDIKNITE